MSGIRQATHAGSWYTSDGDKLRTELTGFLSAVRPMSEPSYAPPIADAKAVIAPHAGYSYSGPAAAWAYAAIPTDKIKRVVLLGPSHHTSFVGVKLSTFAAYATPLGDIPLDLDAIGQLRSVPDTATTRLFNDMDEQEDEDEHSLEMHLPYIRHIFQNRDDLKLVPLLVGALSRHARRDRVSAELKKLWDHDETFFIISSDFCHWGRRFGCTPYYPHAPDPPHPVPPVSKASGPQSSAPLQLISHYAGWHDQGGVPIWKSTQYLDHEGMDLLRAPARPRATDEWEAYLSRTRNTICGRAPITVLLNLMQYVYGDTPAADSVNFSFVRYEQSSKCKGPYDSSVSYVSGILRPNK